MPKANVSIDDIINLRKSIDNGGSNSLSVISNLSGEAASAASALASEETAYNNAAGAAASSLAVGASKESALISAINQLEAELASTPPTIEVYVSDGEDGGHYESRPNPAYTALQAEISSKRSALYQLQALLTRMRELEGEAYEGAKKAGSLKRDCETIRNNLSGIYNDIQSISYDCVKKLDKIEMIVDEYTKVTIDLPLFMRKEDSRLK